MRSFHVRCRALEERWTECQQSLDKREGIVLESIRSSVSRIVPLFSTTTKVRESKSVGLPRNTTGAQKQGAIISNKLCSLINFIHSHGGKRLFAFFLPVWRKKLSYHLKLVKCGTRSPPRRIFPPIYSQLCVCIHDKKPCSPARCFLLRLCASLVQDGYL